MIILQPVSSSSQKSMIIGSMTGTVYNPTENQTQNGPCIHEKSKQTQRSKLWIPVLDKYFEVE
jgi:hypothetical protein